MFVLLKETSWYHQGSGNKVHSFECLHLTHFLFKVNLTSESPLWGAESAMLTQQTKVSSFKPRVVQSIALHALPTARIATFLSSSIFVHST